MRAAPLLTGTILLLLGLGATVTGGYMKDIGDACIQARCDADEVVVFGAWGQGVFGGGFLLGIAGIALLVVGFLPDRGGSGDS